MNSEYMLQVEFDEAKREEEIGRLKESGEFGTMDQEQFSLKYFSAVMNLARRLKLGEISPSNYLTEFHFDVYKTLLSMLKRLANDQFVGQSGNFARVLPGPRGVGKTTCLLNFGSVAPLLAPRVAFFYFSATTLVPILSVLDHGSLCGLVVHQLFGRDDGVVAPPMTRAYNALLWHLVNKNLRLVLVVDAVDQLFQASNQDERCFNFAKESLTELAELGNSRLGRLMIVLSGSSSRLEDFISESHEQFSADEIARIPMLSVKLNMNGTKYMMLNVTLCRPDSLENALAIEHPSNGFDRRDTYSENEISSVRKKMFESGCNARKQESLAVDRSLRDRTLNCSHDLHNLWRQLLAFWYGHVENRRLLVTLGLRKQTWHDMMRYGRWTAFKCEACVQNREVTCAHATAMYEWENQFVPVTPWKMYETHGFKLDSKLDTLQFRGYILRIGDEIFPITLQSFARNLAE